MFNEDIDIKRTLCSRNNTKKVSNFDNIEHVLIF